MLMLMMMMMRVVQVPYAKSISSISISSSSSRNLRVLSLNCTSVCRILKPNKVALNTMIRRIFSVSSSGFHTLVPKRLFASTTLQVFSEKSSPFVQPVIVSSSVDMPQKSEEWFALRRDKLTTSTFSTALGFWNRQSNRRSELWHDKVFDEPVVFDDSARFAMDWGSRMEPAAIEKYKTIMGCSEVGTMGFAVHSEEQFHWLGASPDGVLEDRGILEVKCPYNKGNTDTVLAWSNVPYYYMPQMQGLMEIMDRDWVDLYCWTQNGSTVFRVMRDRSYWEFILEVLKEFWFENVIPAREALCLGKDVEEVKEMYEPTITHELTGLAIAKSRNLAAESKLVCREIADHVEFF